MKRRAEPCCCNIKQYIMGFFVIFTPVEMKSSVIVFIKVTVIMKTVMPSLE